MVPSGRGAENRRGCHSAVGTSKSRADGLQLSATVGGPRQRRAPTPQISDGTASVNKRLADQYPFLSGGPAKRLPSRALTALSYRTESEGDDSPQTFALTTHSGLGNASLPLVQRPGTAMNGVEDISWAPTHGGARRPLSTAPRERPLPRVAMLPSRGSHRPTSPGSDAESRPVTRAATPFGVATCGSSTKPATAHDYVAEKLAVLRTDAALRDTFFAEVARSRAESAAERLREGAAAWSPERTGVNATPALREDMRARSRAEHDEHAKAVARRHDELVAADLERKEKFVAAAYRNRIVERSLAARQERDAHRAALWGALLVSHVVVPRRFDDALKAKQAARAEARRKAEESRGQPLTMDAAAGAFLVLQRWWRRVCFRIKVKRQVRAAAMLRKYFGGMDKIKVKFAVALHRLRAEIVKVQRHWRAVLEVRKRRAAHASRIIDRAIQKECAAVDKAADFLIQQRTQLERQVRAAIKARRPVFEAQLHENQVVLQKTIKRRTLLNALTPESRASLSGDVLELRAANHAEDLLEYGELLAKRKKRVDDAIRDAKTRRTFSSNTFFGLGLKNGGVRLEPIHPPRTKLAISWDEARAIVRVRGVALGFLDFMRVTLKTEPTENDAATVTASLEVLPRMPPQESLPGQTPAAKKGAPAKAKGTRGSNKPPRLPPPV